MELLWWKGYSQFVLLHLSLKSNIPHTLPSPLESTCYILQLNSRWLPKVILFLLGKIVLQQGDRNLSSSDMTEYNNNKKKKNITLTNWHMLILPGCPGSHAVTSVCQAWISVPVASDCGQNLFQKDAVDAWMKHDIFRGCVTQCKQIGSGPQRLIKTPVREILMC